MEEIKSEEEELINQLKPKISEYFTKNKFVEKSTIKQLISFIEFPDITEPEDIEAFWKEISFNSTSKKLTQELFQKNISIYIHNHSSEIFLGNSLIDNVTKFLKRPIKLIEDIDPDNEFMFELYRLLATLDFNDNQDDIPLISLEEALNEYKFINLSKDSIYDLIQELIKEKTNSIKKYDFLEIMEKMGNEYQYKLETKAQKKVIFVEEDLDKPELNNFIYLLTFIKILLKISDSVLLCHEKSIKVIKNNEILNAEYLNRNFFILVNNLKLYFYEIMRIYYEQKQKFDYYICNNNSKISILKQENKDLSEQLKAKDFDNNNDIIKKLCAEIKNEKNKIEDLYKENQDLKKEISSNNDKMYEYDNKIREMEKIQEEKDGKINKLNKENELQKEKYKNVFTQLNSFVLNKKEEEQKLNESIKKMNLSNHLLNLINMDKTDIISLFNEKDKYYTSIENNNKSLQSKIKELEKDSLKKAEEIKELNYNNNILIKKNQELENEIQESQKEMQEQAEKSIILSSVLDDKIDKEDYDNLQSQLNEEKEKNSKLKNNINTLNEEISKKEEDIIRSKNKINSQENIIKENENKINNLNEQIKQNDEKFNELMNKYKNLITKIEQDERKLSHEIDNLNLNEKYQQLINKEKPELIKIIIDKDNCIEKIEEENSLNKNEIKELKKLNQELNDEINKNKSTINDLNKKIFSFENELKSSKTEITQLQKNLSIKDLELNKEKEAKEKLEKILSEEKKKNELLINDIKTMKNEIITQNENISKANNEISLLQNKNNEKDEQINSLTKEKEILNKNYKDLLNKYNEQLSNTKEKEKRASIAIQNLNLTGENLKLANMSKDQLISLIIEKDKYLKMTEDLNKELNLKNEKINKEKNLIEDECNKLKLNIVDLEKKNSLLNQDNEHMNKDIENLTSEKNNLLSDLQKEKTKIENYTNEISTLKQEINDLNQKITSYKNDINNLNTELNTKNDIIQKLENKINIMQSQINDIETQKNDLSMKYKELIEKSNTQLEKIKNYNIKEKTELDLISKLNLSNTYQSLISKSKADLISLIIEKDNLNQKLENEKTELNNKINNLEKVKIEQEKNLADFEAKNNTLNNKIKNLENELNIIKGENDTLLKEKNELNNILKEEKKSGEKMKTANDILIKENAKIEILIKENKKLSEQIENEKNLIKKLEKDITNLKLTLEEKEAKNLNLIQEIEKIKSDYNLILNKYESLNMLLKNKEKAKEDALKNIEEKYNFLKNLLPEEIIKKYIDLDKLYINAIEENNNLKKENSDKSQEIDKLDKKLKASKELKQKYLKVKNEYVKILDDNEKIIKERDEYVKKYNDLLDSIIDKNKAQKIFKSELLSKINATLVYIKSQPIKKKSTSNVFKEKIYDYLCLRLEQRIIDKLKDTHWDGKTVFTESIKYIDQIEKTTSDCILFITNEYFYLFNYNYKCCFASPLVELNLVSVTNKSNYIAIFFQRAESVTLEIFRVLELVNYLRLLKARQKSLKFQINIEPYIYTNQGEIMKKNNFIECLYYGKALISGNFSQVVEGIFSNKSEERFGFLCEVGLVILESYNGKPLRIINLLFADISIFNTKEGNNGLGINVRGEVYKLIFDNEKLRDQWKNAIKEWKESNFFLTKF